MTAFGLLSSFLKEVYRSVFLQVAAKSCPLLPTEAVTAQKTGQKAWDSKSVLIIPTQLKIDNSFTLPEIVFHYEHRDSILI